LTAQEAAILAELQRYPELAAVATEPMAKELGSELLGAWMQPQDLFKALADLASRARYAAANGEIWSRAHFANMLSSFVTRARKNASARAPVGATSSASGFAPRKCAPPAPFDPSEQAVVDEILAYHKAKLGQTAELESRDHQAIVDRLREGHGVKALKRAVRGMAVDTWADRKPEWKTPFYIFRTKEKFVEWRDKAPAVAQVHRLHLVEDGPDVPPAMFSEPSPPPPRSAPRTAPGRLGSAWMQGASMAVAASAVIAAIGRLP